MGDVGPAELVIVLVVILVLFGGAKLPELARSLGKAKKEFHRGLEEGMPDPAPKPAQQPAPAPGGLPSPPSAAPAEPLAPPEGTEGPIV